MGCLAYRVFEAKLGLREQKESLVHRVPPVWLGPLPSKETQDFLV